MGEQLSQRGTFLLEEACQRVRDAVEREEKGHKREPVTLLRTKTLSLLALEGATLECPSNQGGRPLGYPSITRGGTKVAVTLS